MSEVIDFCQNQLQDPKRGKYLKNIAARKKERNDS